MAEKKAPVKQESQETPKVSAEKLKSIELTFTQIEKQFGEGSIMRLGQDKVLVSIPVISTGALTLDIALGVGGVPRGRVVEIFGPEASGKTTLGLTIIANAQRDGGLGAYIDAEHAIDPGYAKRLGVNLDDLLISQPDCGEDALNIAEMLVKSNAIDVVVVDSVAALVPRAELEGDIGDSHVGLQARLMSQALRKLTSAVSRSKTCVVFINQIREKIGVMFGNPETTPGGRALKFYSSVRLDIRRIESIKSSKDEVTGNRVRVKVVKNKVAPPFRQAEFDILFNEGISKEGTILDLAVEHRIVEKRGTWYTYGDQRIAQGRDSAREELRNNPQLRDEIAGKVMAAVKIPRQ
jgi:recombination protein RecA